MILALDPGTERSAWVLYHADKRLIADHGIHDNNSVLDLLRHINTNGCRLAGATVLAIEMIASYGMPVGREVFETVFWAGRFVEAARPIAWVPVYRRDVKLALCGNVRAKDPNIRRALLDKFGPPGTKKKPGVTYGIQGDEWAALAVAVTAAA